MHENVQELDISSGNVNVDLDHGQSFNLLVDLAVRAIFILYLENSTAEAFPIPEEAPVISTSLFVKENFFIIKKLILYLVIYKVF